MAQESVRFSHLCNLLALPPNPTVDDVHARCIEIENLPSTLATLRQEKNQWIKELLTLMNTGVSAAPRTPTKASPSLKKRKRDNVSLLKHVTSRNASNEQAKAEQALVTQAEAPQEEPRYSEQAKKVFDYLHTPIKEPVVNFADVIIPESRTWKMFKIGEDDSKIGNYEFYEELRRRFQQRDESKMSSTKTTPSTSEIAAAIPQNLMKEIVLEVHDNMHCMEEYGLPDSDPQLMRARNLLAAFYLTTEPASLPQVRRPPPQPVLQNWNGEMESDVPNPAQSEISQQPLKTALAATVQLPKPSVLRQNPTYRPLKKYTHRAAATSYKWRNYKRLFGIRHRGGDILDSMSDRIVIVHAVNCQGVWGAGFAFSLKAKLPTAFQTYRDHCRKKKDGLIGTCLLIPPKRKDYEQKDCLRNQTVYQPRRWVACLFTSRGYGVKGSRPGNPGRSSAADILQYTRSALTNFRQQLEQFGSTNFDGSSWKTDDEKPGRIASPFFNSGKFGVPWPETARVLKEGFEGFERDWYVYDGKALEKRKHVLRYTGTIKTAQTMELSDENDWGGEKELFDFSSDFAPPQQDVPFTWIPQMHDRRPLPPLRRKINSEGRPDNTVIAFY